MSVLLVPCKFLVRSTTCCIRAILLRTRGGGFLHGHVGKYTQGVSATPPPRWTITPLFYSRSTDLPVLRGRRRVDGDDARRRTELHYSGSVGEDIHIDIDIYIYIRIPSISKTLASTRNFALRWWRTSITERGLKVETHRLGPTARICSGLRSQ